MAHGDLVAHLHRPRRLPHARAHCLAVALLCTAGLAACYQEEPQVVVRARTAHVQPCSVQHALLGSGKVAFTVQPFPFRDFVARVPWLRQPLRTHRCAVCASHCRCKASGHAEGPKGSKVVGVAAAAAHTAGGTATALWFPRTARSFSLEAAAHAAFRHPNTVAEYAQ